MVLITDRSTAGAVTYAPPADLVAPADVAARAAAVPARPRSILVATSASKSSEGALRVARALAARHGADVRLLAVFAPRIPVPPIATSRRAKERCEQPDRREAAALLRSVRAQRRHLLGAENRWPIVFDVGHPPFRIDRLAREEGVDLVVLGLGRELPDARRLGDQTAAQLALLSDTPVLAVHPSATELPRHALILNGQRPDPTLLRWTRAVLRRDGDAFRGIDTKWPARAVAFAATHDIDLLVLPVRGRDFDLRRLVDQSLRPVLHAAHCSVLVVPVHTEAVARRQAIEREVGMPAGRD